MAQQRQRTVRVTGRERHRAGRRRGCRVQHGRLRAAPPLPLLGQGVQLPGRRARRVEPAEREGDLDLGHEQPAAPERLGVLVVRQGQVQGGRRGLGLALGEPQQGQTGLRVAAVLVRAVVGLLGRGQIPAPPLDLPDHIERLGGHPPLVRQQFLDGPRGLGEGLGPVAAQLQHLRPVHPAQPAEVVLRGHRRAPAHGRVRPLGGAAEVDAGHGLLKAQAVDPPGEEGGQLAGHGRAHRVVQQVEPVADPALRHQDTGLRLHAQGGQVRAAAAPGDRGHPPGRDHRLLERPARLRLLGVDPDQVALLHALRLVPQLPPGPAQPARRQRRAPGQLVLVEEQPGHVSRPSGIAGRHKPGVGPHAMHDRLVDPAAPPGGVGERGAVVRGEPRGVHTTQQPVRVGPVLPGRGVPGTAQGVRR